MVYSLRNKKIEGKHRHREMSKTTIHFFKHLSYALIHHQQHQPIPSSLTPLLIWKPKLPHQWRKPISLLVSRIPISSSSAAICSCTSITGSHANNNDAPSSSLSTTTAASDESSNAAYFSVRIRCPKHLADSLSDAVLCFGASSTSIMDEEDDGCASSNEICIDSIFPGGEDVDLCLSQAANSIGLEEIPNYEVKVGEQDDWVRRTLVSFHPVEVAEGLWIVPEWRSPPDVQAMNIILNPGLAFGTGEHQTTKLCLLLLQDLIKGGELFLDYGTGSGILAIAALKFGAALSVGFDVDPQAITSARHNATLNNIRPEAMELHLVAGNTFSLLMDGSKDEVMKEQSCYGSDVISETERYDVVVANMLLNPLLELADHIVSYAKHGATVGLSGILSEQCSCIVDRYSVLLEDISVVEMDGWACVSGRKKSNFSRIGKRSSSSSSKL